MSLQDTPRSDRLHIGIFGKVNSGKSSLINALTNQSISIVSNVEGTTTDPIYKAMEIHGIGPVVFIDTAGFSDESVLGEKRNEKTKDAADKTDIALVVFSDLDMDDGIRWVHYFEKKHTEVIVIINKIDSLDHVDEMIAKLKEYSLFPILVSTITKQGIDEINEAMIKVVPNQYCIDSITGSLCSENDVVLLVMPQDIQAPKGRLILPQVQTIRDLLDKQCIVLSCTSNKFQESLNVLKVAPNLIICDSQIFKMVYEQKPKESKLTSFSVLFAHYKGDLTTYIEGAKAIDLLHENSRVLIAEACTHAPLSEDIGRVKIPAMLRRKFGESLEITIVSGPDFPDDLSDYDLIIQCGCCMFNRKYVLSRIERAKQAKVAITNYGICIAHITQILDKIDLQL